LKRLPELDVNFVDTSDAYGPDDRQIACHEDNPSPHRQRRDQIARLPKRTISPADAKMWARSEQMVFDK
jgi:hypothetical protein